MELYFYIWLDLNDALFVNIAPKTHSMSSLARLGSKSMIVAMMG